MFNTKADFDRAYSLKAGEGVRLGYCRQVMMPYCERHADNIHNLFDLKNKNILFIGAGFGWTIEVLEQKYGYENILGTDTSDWVIDNLDTFEDTDIDDAIKFKGFDPTKGKGLALRRKLNKGKKRSLTKRKIVKEDLLTQQSRDNVLSILGSIDICLTEEVISCLKEPEVLNLSNILNTLGKTIHLTTEKLPNTNQDPIFTWKTLREWKELLPNDIIVSVNTWQHL